MCRILESAVVVLGTPEMGTGGEPRHAYPDNMRTSEQRALILKIRFVSSR